MVFKPVKMGKSIEIRKFWSEQLVETFSQEQNNDIGVKLNFQQLSLKANKVSTSVAS